MPGRYAKNEQSAGFLGSMDSYAYRSPGFVQPVGAVSQGQADGVVADAKP